MTARAIYGGVPTFQLPPAKGGPGQVIQSLGNGYTEWVTGGGGGGGVVDEVQAGQNIAVDNTDPAAPIVSLDLPAEPAGGKFLTSSTTTGVYTWTKANDPGVQIVQGSQYIDVNATNPTAPVVALKLPSEPEAGKVLTTTSLNGLYEWTTPGGGGGITEIEGSLYISIDETNPGAPAIVLDLPQEAQSGKVLTTTTEPGVYVWEQPITTISGIAPLSVQSSPGSRTIDLQYGGYLNAVDSILNLAVAKPNAADLVLSSTTSGVLSWVSNSGGGGITEIEGSLYISIDETNPGAPAIVLDLPPEASSGKVLTTTAEPGVYTWETPGGGGGGITEVQAGQYVAVDSTDPAAPVVKVQINGTYITGHNVGSIDGGASLNWVTPYAYTAGFGISVIAETVSDSSINLNVEGTPGPGKVIEFNGGTGGIVWAAPGVASIEAGANVVVSNLEGLYTIRVPIGNTYEPGKFVGGDESGHLQWETPTGSGGGITGITQGPGILVANTDPAAPTVSIDLSAGFGMSVNNELATVALAPQGTQTEGALLSLVSGELTWTPPTPSVTRVDAGDNVAVTEPLTGVYNIAVPILNTHAVGKFVGGDQTGALEWAYPPTAEPYTAGLGLALSLNQFSVFALGSPHVGDVPAYSDAANLTWTRPTTGTVTRVGALNYMRIQGDTFTAPDIGLKFAAGPYAQVGQVLTAADTVGDSLEWTTPTTGTVTNVLGNDYIYISGSSNNIPTVELNIEGEPQGQENQILTASGTTNLLKWTTPGGVGFQIIPTLANPTWTVYETIGSPIAAIISPGSATTILKYGKMCISNATSQTLGFNITNDLTGVTHIYASCTNLGSIPLPIVPVSVAGNCFNTTTQATYIGTWTLRVPVSTGDPVITWTNDVLLRPLPEAGDTLTLIMPAFVYETA